MMATEKTPTGKRIKRAEKGRDEWKVKANERREEIQFLKNEIQKKQVNLDKIIKLNKTMNEELTQTKKRIDELEELLKKKK